ncbi:hypothetical protein HYH02_005138 [Chlamydomonas schloesseri]|uniref:Secreted protein n=1 Tax=Chlamydomonas schloesseri TaxID=2026947 RepID=A0A835WLE8_9CHLO|nr:hypothetical protein HYH02_005138 [Chlamydomonas schloesseri]|eukprot:KAG2449605.1 hypothetical protein HYH02_005138 [Chlamydomonas schloesseri]
MVTSFFIACAISLVLGLSPAIPRTLMFISTPSCRKVNEGSLWLGFGLVGPAGAATVAAETAAFHCLLDGVLIKRGAAGGISISRPSGGNSSSEGASKQVSGGSGNDAVGADAPALAECAAVESVAPAVTDSAASTDAAAGAADDDPLLDTFAAAPEAAAAARE